MIKHNLNAKVYFTEVQLTKNDEGHTEEIGIQLFPGKISSIAKLKNGELKYLIKYANDKYISVDQDSVYDNYVDARKAVEVF